MIYELKMWCKGAIVDMMKQRWPSQQGGLLFLRKQNKGLLKGCVYLLSVWFET